MAVYVPVCGFISGKSVAHNSNLLTGNGIAHVCVTTELVDLLAGGLWGVYAYRYCSGSTCSVEASDCLQIRLLLLLARCDVTLDRLILCRTKSPTMSFTVTLTCLHNQYV